MGRVNVPKEKAFSPPKLDKIYIPSCVYHRMCQSFLQLLGIIAVLPPCTRVCVCVCVRALVCGYIFVYPIVKSAVQLLLESLRV